MRFLFVRTSLDAPQKYVRYERHGNLLKFYEMQIFVKLFQMMYTHKKYYDSNESLHLEFVLLIKMCCNLPDTKNFRCTFKTLNYWCQRMEMRKLLRSSFANQKD